MIGIVIVAHAGLAEALRGTLVHVVGEQPGIQAVSIGPNEDLRKAQAQIASAVAEVEAGSGVVLVTDMFGGTPSNLAHGAMSAPGIEVVYGANMPLLVKLAKSREMPLAEAVQAAIDSGRKYVNSAGAILNPGPRTE